MLAPPDIEARTGLVGGNIMQGEMTPDQMFSFRPIPFYGDHRTPVPGLYLCGAGTHPGGGVMGIARPQRLDRRAEGREAWRPGGQAQRGGGTVRGRARTGARPAGVAPMPLAELAAAVREGPDHGGRAGGGLAGADRASRRSGELGGPPARRCRARRRRRDRRARGAAAGSRTARGAAAAGEGHRGCPGPSHDVRVPAVRGRHAGAARLRGRRAAASCRRDRRRQDEHARVRARGVHVEPHVRRHAQPVGAGLVARRLERRERRRADDGAGAAGHRDATGVVRSGSRRRSAGSWG